MSTTKVKGSPLVRFKAFEKRNSISRDASGDIKSQTTTLSVASEPAAADTELFDVVWASGNQSRLTTRKEFDFHGNVSLAIGRMSQTDNKHWVNLGGALLIAVHEIAMLVRVDE